VEKTGEETVMLRRFCEPSKRRPCKQRKRTFTIAVRTRALALELVDCAFRVAYISNATSMPGLCCSYGCFSGLHYVMLLWFELCDCLCMPL
jgi:hypothetical protein